MPVRLFGLKSCDSCRAAIRAMASAMIEVEIFDVRTDGVPGDILHMALEQLGEDRLVNRQSRSWRELDQAQRQAPALELLTANPTLVKRPLVVTGEGRCLVGWNDDTRAALGIGRG